MRLSRAGRKPPRIVERAPAVEHWPPMSRRDDAPTGPETMLRSIRAQAQSAAHWTGAPDLDPRVLAAMAAVPRDRFVDVNPWDDRPQAIGHGQTISQPFIVALMTHFLSIEPGVRVLEVGCGSGYQAAVLAEMGARVLSLERIPALADAARATLAACGYADRVTVRAADGFEPQPEAPFARIILTAAPERIPESLIADLAPGGRLIGPKGRRHEAQMLTLILKDADGALDERAVLPVAFVPMLGGVSSSR
jgi:protein-L-isoaspartate(D-aspartate) O-methyltransferase